MNENTKAECANTRPLSSAQVHCTPARADGQERDAAKDLAMCQASMRDISTLDYLEFADEALPYWINRCMAAEAGPALEDIVRSVEPSARVYTSYDIHSETRYPDMERTLAAAEEIAAAIIAEYGGSVLTVPFRTPCHSATGSVNVTIRDRVQAHIYYYAEAAVKVARHVG